MRPLLPHYNRGSGSKVRKRALDAMGLRQRLGLFLTLVTRDLAVTTG
jgi:hypothetical protein